MTELVSWIDAGGTSHPLNGENQQLGLQGPLGAFMPPIQLVELEVPQQPGSRIQQVKILPRDFTLPLGIIGASDTDGETAMRSVASWFNPALADGIIQRTRPDGSIRQLNCRYQSGYEGDEGPDNAGTYWQVFHAAFRATDPFWYDQNFTAPTFTTWAGNITITLGGDWPVWPIWTLHGPGSAFSMTVTYPDGTTKTLALTNAGGITLAGTDQIVIDTRPGKKSVFLNTTTNKYSLVNLSNALFPLQVGTNTIAVSLTGSSGASLLTCQYKQAYFTM